MVHTGTVSSRRPAVCISFLLCLLVVGAARSAFACAPSPYLSVTPSSGWAGSTTTVKGENFQQLDVEIRWNGVTGTVLATTKGPSFSESVTIPNVEPGVYYMVAVARAADGGVKGRASGAFEVTPRTTTATTTARATEPERSGSGGESQPQPSAPEGGSTASGPSSSSASPSSASPQNSNDAPAPARPPAFAPPPRNDGQPAKAVAAIAAAPARPAGTASMSGAPEAIGAIPPPTGPTGFVGVERVSHRARPEPGRCVVSSSPAGTGERSQPRDSAGSV